MKKLIINIDGGSRGNPGPGAIGIVMLDDKENILKEYADYIGKVTNNQAEYKALIFALKKTKALFGKEKIKELPVEIRSDSELLINQVNGKYKIKEKEIKNLFLDFWNEKIDFGNLKFIQIDREKNKLADKLVNEVLNKSL
ncbi:MAG: ribonuclease HI family protein [Minisyncoccia bacterium]